MANKRLIDANALSEEVDKSKHNNPHPPGMVRVNHRNEHDHFLRMIYDAPTVDVVEVVRCKDCKECFTRANGTNYCRRTGRYASADDFCSYGERRGNDNERKAD